MMRTGENSYVYYAVMVRLWREEVDSPCRASAQLSSGGEVQPFADLDALFAYLTALAGETAPISTDDDMPGSSTFRE